MSLRKNFKRWQKRSESQGMYIWLARCPLSSWKVDGNLLAGYWNRIYNYIADQILLLVKLSKFCWLRIFCSNISGSWATSATISSTPRELSVHKESTLKLYWKSGTTSKRRKYLRMTDLVRIIICHMFLYGPVTMIQWYGKHILGLGP